MNPTMYELFHSAGMKLPPLEEIKRWPETAWQPATRPVLHEWLAHETSAEKQSRAHACGNVVIPDQAFLAMCLLGHGSI